MGNVVGLCWALGNTLHWVMLLGLGQHTLLGNIVGLCWATGNTLHWVLFIVGLCEVSENTFLCIIVDQMWGPQQWTFNNLNNNSRKACFCISAETAEAILPQSNNLIFTNLRLPPNPSEDRYAIHTKLLPEINPLQSPINQNLIPTTVS
jgi:hypothetical protein